MVRFRFILTDVIYRCNLDGDSNVCRAYGTQMIFYKCKPPLMLICFMFVIETLK